MSNQDHSASPQEDRSFWKRWIADTPVNENAAECSESSSPAQHEEGWWNRYMTTWFHQDETLDITDSMSYHQLSKKQIKILENEAEQVILKGHDTYCWFNDTMSHTTLDSDGVLCVFNTGSASCPLPLAKYPLVMPETRTRIEIKNSVILPGVHPAEYAHELPLRTKLAHAVKDHYNFDSEKHLYLRKNPTQVFSDDTIIVISLHGSLPNKYEQVGTGRLPTSLDLNRQMLKTLLGFEPNRLLTFSIECPLDVKPTSEVLEEAMSLLKNWQPLLAEATRLFVSASYHSVPLSLFLTDSILERFKPPHLQSIGILGIDSCLQGYQFWNHSAEITPQSMENPNFQLNKEKALYEGCSKQQQETLSKFRNYREKDSLETRRLLSVLDRLVLHHPSLRISLVGTLHDNFLTVSQKLALDYLHPVIQRKIWCDGSFMGMDYNALIESIPNEPLASDKKTFDIPIPKERNFEISLINNLLLAINLGHSELIPLMKEVSPYFISRSFNEWTCPAPRKKQLQADLKTWLQDKDAKWKEVTVGTDSFLPKEISTYPEAFEYFFYKSQRSPDSISIESSLYHDVSVYQSFIYDTILTANLQTPRGIRVRNSGSGKVLNNVNEYNLVWNLHESMGYYSRIKNLPTNVSPITLTAQLSTQNSPFSLMFPSQASFSRTTHEASKRLGEIWRNYQTWNPSTTGLVQLKNIFSVLSLYDSSKQLLNDVSIV